MWSISFLGVLIDWRRRTYGLVFCVLFFSAIYMLVFYVTNIWCISGFLVNNLCSSSSQLLAVRPTRTRRCHVMRGNVSRCNGTGNTAYVGHAFFVEKTFTCLSLSGNTKGPPTAMHAPRTSKYFPLASQIQLFCTRGCTCFFFFEKERVYVLRMLNSWHAVS
jgi:hypothetical protein